MIKYKDSRMVIDCDNCGISDYYEGTYKGCLDRAKNNDWISVKDTNDEWINFCCCECKDEYDSSRDLDEER